MIKRLPDAEFEVMKILWRCSSPTTTLQIIEKLEPVKDWKPQTVLTILARLIEKGFLKSERIGRERNYTPIIQEQEYMRIETGEFMNRYRGNSLGSLVKTLYDEQGLSDDALHELREWLEKRK